MMANDVQDRVQPVIETLIRLAQDAGVAVTGFIFGVEGETPLIMHFGNVIESSDPFDLADLHRQLDNAYARHFAHRQYTNIDDPGGKKG